MRKLCWLAIPCSGAIFLSVYLFPEPFLIPIGAFCLLGAALAFLFRGKARCKILLASLGLSVGFLWTGCYGSLYRTPSRTLINTEAQLYSFVVSDFPKETRRGASLVGLLLDEDSNQQYKVQIYADHEALGLLPGDKATATIRLASSDLMRGESIDYYESKGIYLLGYVQESIALIQRPEHIPFRYLPQQMAKWLKDTVITIFPEDVSGFINALLTGDKSFLPTGVYAAFQRSGISHMVAVSGLHIGFLAGLFSLLLGKRSRLAALFSLILIIFFAAMTGNSPSALRAVFMTAFLLLAPLVGRENDKPTTLSLILLLLLLKCPYAAASVSLQLSFAAVAGIYLITEPLNAHWRKAFPKWKSPAGKLAEKGLFFFSGTLSATLGALLFTTPLTAIHFGCVSLVGPLTNLLTLWAVSFTFLGGLFVSLLGLFSTPLAILPAQIVAWPARWILWIAQSVSRWPFASISLLSGYLSFWLLVAYSIIFLWLIFRKSIRPMLPLSVLCITFCSALLTNIWPALSNSLTVSVLDVGQGAATLFYSKGYTVLVDCGGNRSDDAGDIAADYLQSLGTSHLDALILTHYHSDHADGVPELLARIDVSLLILPDVTPEEPLRHEVLSLAQKYNCKVELLSNDLTLSFGDAAFTIYAPLGRGTANEEGLSLLCTTNDYDILVTGDMDGTVEKRLIKYKDLPDIELLIVGHHGSKNSTGEELLLSTMPEAAVISVGYNSYGHPSPETLERLGAAGCDIYRTDLMGTVTFSVKGD